MNGRCGDAEGGLRCHASLRSPFYAWYDVSDIVESTEDTRNVHTLCVLHLIHELTHIVGYGIHPESVESTVEHVCLNADLVERLTESSNGIVGVFTSQEVYLLESASISLHSCKTPHVDNDWCYTLKLFLAWLKLTGRLPHVSIDKTKLDFLFHRNLSLKC